MGKFSEFNSDSIRIVDYGSLQPYGYNVVDWNLVFKKHENIFVLLYNPLHTTFLVNNGLGLYSDSC